MRPHPLLLLLLTLTLTLASPTPIHPRTSCTTHPASVLQILSEANPTTPFPNLALLGGHFLVSSAAPQKNRTYQAIRFTNIPPNSWGCSLNILLPASSATRTIGHPILNIHSLSSLSISSTSSPFTQSQSQNWTWSDLNHSSTKSLIGTLDPTLPSSSSIMTINSQNCPIGERGEGGNLTFLFTIAEWVRGEAAFYFNTLQAEGVEVEGVFLSYNC